MTTEPSVFSAVPSEHMAFAALQAAWLNCRASIELWDFDALSMRVDTSWVLFMGSISNHFFSGKASWSQGPS